MEDRPPIELTLILVALSLLLLATSEILVNLSTLTPGDAGAISGMAFLGGAALLVVSLAFLADHALH